MRVLLSILALGFTLQAQAQIEKITLIEKPENYQKKPIAGDPRPYLVDSYYLYYTQDDYSDKIGRVNLVFSPKDFRQEMGVTMDCSPYESNFEVIYLENPKVLEEGGKLPNTMPRFAKRGYVYNDEQEVEVTVGKEDESLDVDVGGQIKHFSRYFVTDLKHEKTTLGMSFHFEFVSQEAPEFTQRRTSSDAKDFFALLKQAIETEQTMTFELEADSGHERQLVWDAKRMAEFVPREVLEYCILNRELR